MTISTGQALYVALKKKYQSQVKEGQAILLIYFANSVGIGDHSTHLEDMDKLVGKISEAEDKLKVLKKYFNCGENGEEA